MAERIAVIEVVAAHEQVAGESHVVEVVREIAAPRRGGGLRC